MAKALGHPLRMAILTELNKRVASPAELARDLDDSVGNVSYHVRVLLGLQCIELVETRPKRGSVEHFYRAMTRPELDDEAWGKLEPAARTAMASQWFQRTFADVARALEAGQLAAPDLHISSTPMELDEAGWAEMSAAMLALLDRGLRLHAEAAVRDAPKRSGQKVIARFDAAPRT